jgi:hypothetical protein
VCMSNGVGTLRGTLYITITCVSVDILVPDPIYPKCALDGVGTLRGTLYITVEVHIEGRN